MTFGLNRKAIARMQGIGIIVLLLGVVFAGVGYYYYTLPPPKLVIDWWYESSGHYPQSADQAAVYKSQMEKTGLITVNLHGADWASYKTNRDAHSMQVYVYGWYPDYIDPDDYIQPFLDSVGGGWLGTGYNNPDMDKLIAQARSISDPTQRNQLYLTSLRTCTTGSSPCPQARTHWLLGQQTRLKLA
jgi:ABC-type transport system substrate-binding protein